MTARLVPYLKEKKKWLGIIGLSFDMIGVIILLFFYGQIEPYEGQTSAIGHLGAGKPPDLVQFPESTLLLYVGFVFILVGFVLLLLKEIISD